MRSLIGDRCLLTRADIVTILREMETGKQIAEIFSPEGDLPSFAYHEFRSWIKKDPELRELYESVQYLRTHRLRAEIEGMSNEDTPKDGVSSKKLRFEMKRHLEMVQDPDLRIIEEETGVAQAAVVIMPRKAPKGLAAQISAALLDSGSALLEAGDDGRGD